jgi:predicted phage terminase large subunit-like protein
VSSKVEAARELLRRARARDSLHSFALSVDIPLSPNRAMMLDEDLLGPAASLMAGHHALIIDTVQRALTTRNGRAIIMAPPGSAKSSYTSVVAPPWMMARSPGYQMILASYGGELAEKMSRRQMMIAGQQAFKDFYPYDVSITKDAAKNWAMANGSELMACGILGGVTGNRADALIIDDPVAGREEADSEATRKKVMDAYQDDLLTRLKRDGSVILMMTRWHEQDLAGEILPENYKGESGRILCRDGMLWDVVNLPAKCERPDDPLKRKPGEYLWPEWFPPDHWQKFENAPGPLAARRWASLYQQNPTPQGAGSFLREHFEPYMYNDDRELPPRLGLVGASDFAVTAEGGDFTEHGVFGMDANGDLWALDWWSGQKTTDVTIEAMLDLALKYRTPMWFNEGGVIDKSVKPAINRRMRERRVIMDVRSIPSMSDKVSKCMSFQARAASGKVHFPRHKAWTERVVGQLLSLPAGRYDDAADVCGLVGRAVDQYHPAQPAPPPRAEGIKPFTAAWLEYEEPKAPSVRFR